MTLNKEVAKLLRNKTMTRKVITDIKFMSKKGTSHLEYFCKKKKRNYGTIGTDKKGEIEFIEEHH